MSTRSSWQAALVQGATTEQGGMDAEVSERCGGWEADLSDALRWCDGDGQ
jgi:hypothetical protein